MWTFDFSTHKEAKVTQWQLKIFDAFTTQMSSFFFNRLSRKENKLNLEDFCCLQLFLSADILLP